MSDLYQEIILDELAHPQHKGVLEGADVLTRHERNASCGDEVTVYLRMVKNLAVGSVSESTNDADPAADSAPYQLAWQGQGCAISMATMSLLADLILSKQLTSQQIMALKLPDLLELLGLEEISPGRLKCVMLGLVAVQKTLC